MTDITERLAAIEARVEAATEGPWRFEPEDESHCGEPQCCSDYWDNRIWGADRVLAESHMLSEADAEFIAHARTDVPWLVEQVRELQAENESLRTALRRKENHRARARERARQRDEVIEQVRAILTREHIPGEDWYEDSARVSDAIAALEGDGR